MQCDGKFNPITIHFFRPNPTLQKDKLLETGDLGPLCHHIFMYIKHAPNYLFTIRLYQLLV